MKNSVPLGQLVDIVGGGTPSRDKPDYFSGSIPWMTVKDYGDNFEVSSTKERITKLRLDRSSARLISAGNVILATRMAVGRVVLNRVDLAINQDLKALLCKEKLTSKYIGLLSYFAGVIS